MVGVCLHEISNLGMGKLRLVSFIYLSYTNCDTELYHMTCPCPELTLISGSLDNIKHQ